MTPQTSKIPSLYTLLQHQRFGSNFIQERKKSANLSDPGAGKTLTWQDALTRQPYKRILVVCPKSIMQAGWGDSIEQFTPEIPYVCAYAHNREQAFQSNATAVIINHDGVNWLAANPKYLKDFSHVNIDEAHAFKTRTAERSKAMRKVIQKIDNVHIMTGSPMANDVTDIWHLIYLLDDGERLGQSFYQFRSTVCEAKQTNFGINWTAKPHAEEAIYAKLKDIAFRFRLRDCVDLPPNIQTERFVTLPPGLRNQYDKLAKDLLLELEDTTTTINKSALFTKLFQLASGGVYTEDGKFKTYNQERFELAIELALEVPQAVIAFNWKHQRYAMEALLKKMKIPFSFIDGSVNDNDRVTRVRDFQAGKLRILLLHPAAAGLGLTLTRGRRTVWVSPTPILLHWEQLNARIDRIGQEHPTETIVLCGKDTVELGMLEACKRKELRQSKFKELLRQSLQ